MKDKPAIAFSTFPFFIFLLPIFFVFHGVTENYGLVPLSDAALLLLVYIGFALLFWLLFQLVLRDKAKSALMAFLIMGFHFFFGSIQDMLRHFFPGSFLSKYTFLIPACLVILIIVLVYLKTKQPTLRRLIFYLNLLFTLFIVIDIGMLITRASRQKRNPLPEAFLRCDSCSRPDIYLIVADEYAGNEELKDIFNFDDSAFLNQLNTRGFHVIPHSSSNYNYTPYSIASILNMDYLDLANSSSPPLTTAYQTIAHDYLLNYLQHNDYKFYNYSFFDFPGQPSLTQETFLPNKTRLITGQTFISRIEKELRFLLVTKLRSNSEMRAGAYFNRNNNNKLLDLTVRTSKEASTRPRFVFTHLMLPHYPYYYDKNGNEYSFESLAEGNQGNRDHYISYLQYANDKLLGLADSIKINSKSPPLIILMGDHGFRHFDTAIDSKYLFQNLVAVLTPQRDYSGISDSLTNVNLFRSILNKTFHQQLPYLRDTAIIIDNP